MGKAAEEWNFGDVDAQFKQVQGGLRGTLRHRLLAHHSMEPRTCMAYWQNGKCFVHGSCRASPSRCRRLAQMLGIKPEEVVLIAEYCGGGFGSKGGAYPVHGDSGLHVEEDRQAGDDAHQPRRGVLPRLGAQRLPGPHQAGLRAPTASCWPPICTSCRTAAPTSASGTTAHFGDAVALVYQPKAMRWRGMPVFCNTPTRTAQRGPGHNQLACIMEPLVDRAARELKIDRVEIRTAQQPGEWLAERRCGRQARAVTSCLREEALDKGRAKFNWDERKKKSGQRNGPNVTGIGVGQAYHPAGFFGFDGLLCLKPDGKLHIHTGVGNLGTFSHSGTSRIAAEVLKIDWENCVIERGDSRKNLPWNIGQFGSNTSYTMTRTNYVAALDLLAKLKEIAAKDLGGKPETTTSTARRYSRRRIPRSP